MKWLCKKVHNTVYFCKKIPFNLLLGKLTCIIFTWVNKIEENPHRYRLEWGKIKMLREGGRNVKWHCQLLWQKGKSNNLLLPGINERC